MKKYKLQVLKTVLYVYETGSVYDDECNVCKDAVEMYLCRLECITDNTACTMPKVYPEYVGYVVMELLKKIKWPASLEIDTDIDIPLRPKWEQRVESRKSKERNPSDHSISNWR